MERSRADPVLAPERRTEIRHQTKDRLEIESLRTRSAARPSRVDVSCEDVSDAVAAGGLPGISENSPARQGKGKGAKAH